MNSDTGEFLEERDAEAWMKRISVGEVIKLKGEDCKVVQIGARTITLELMSRADLEAAMGQVLAKAVQHGEDSAIAEAARKLRDENYEMGKLAKTSQE